MINFTGAFFYWIHIASAAILIGGIIYARFFARSFAERFRPAIWATAIAIPVSGTYNFLTKGSVPAAYYLVFGIKMLFVLHILAVALLITTRAADQAKRLRLMTGVAMSGVIVFLLSAFLREMSIG